MSGRSTFFKGSALTFVEGIANSHLETERNLKGTVTPIVQRLHQELKNKTKELEKGAFKGSKEVDKARNSTQKHIELLGQHTAAFSSSGGKVEPSTDPYILQRGVKHRLNKQVLEENNNRNDLISVQDQFKSFEGHVIETLQQAMQAFLQVVGGQGDRQKVMYSDIVANTMNIRPDFEWNGFIARNSGTLIDPNAPKRTVTNIGFANQDHQSTKPLIAGSLERKSRVALKGYDTGYYVVTPSKYLHQFKDDDDFRTDPSPELSLYLPDCTVGALSGEKFNVKGKDASKGKVGSAMAMTSELSFKAHSNSDAEKWYAVIKDAARGVNIAPISAATSTSGSTSTPTTPAGSRNVSGTQAPPPAQQPTPIQTSVGTQKPTGYQASPLTAGSGSATGPVQPGSAGGGAALAHGGVAPTPTSAGGTHATPTSGVPGKPGQY